MKPLNFLPRNIPPAAFSWIVFLLLLLPGTGLRILHLLDCSTLPLLATVIGPDVSEYHSHAMQLLAGELLPAGVPIHAPLYAAFLAFLLKITAMDYFAVRLVQSLLLMTFTALPVFLMMQNCADGGEKQEKNRLLLPALAVLLLTLYPPMAVYQCELISEPLMIVLSLWGLFFATRAAAPLKKSAFCLSGLFCTLALLTHPNSLLFFIALFFFLLFEMRRNPGRITFSRLALFLLPFLLLVLPFSLWNSHLAGRAIFIQANSGFNYYLGNNPAATGTCYIPPGLAWEKVHANAAAAAAAEATSTDACFLKETMHGILRHPLRFGGLLLKKAALALNGQEFTTWSDIAVLKELFLHRHLYSGSFAILLLLSLPLLLCGLADGAFRSRMKWFLLYFISFYISQILLLTAGRYRLPLTVPLCVFAAYFLCAPGTCFATTRKTALWCAALLFTAWIAFWPFQRDIVRERNYALSVLAESWLRSGNPAKAEELLAVADDPLFNDRRCNLLGEVMLAKGDPAAAELWFRKAMQDYPNQYHGYMNCGTLLLDAKRWDQAEELFAKARPLVRDASGMADLDYNTGRLHHARGEIKKAEEYYRKALSHVPTHRRALNNLGALTLAEKKYPEAVQLFQKASKLEPLNDRLHVNLALAYFLSGRKAAAEKELQKALRLNPESEKARFLLEDFRKNG